MLTTEVTVTDLPEEKKESAGGMGGYDVRNLKHYRFALMKARGNFSLGPSFLGGD